MITTARIPEKFVMVSGAGQADFGPGLDPWETTSYDIALLEAGIGNYNIVQYSSILPPEAKKITLEQAEQLGLLHHGMVLECIMAHVNGRQGEHVCAGIGIMEVSKRTDAGLEVVGGYAAEYEGNLSCGAAEEALRRSLEEIFARRYGSTTEYCVSDLSFITKDLVIDQDFGTVLAALGFVSFIRKEIKKEPSQSGVICITSGASSEETKAPSDVCLLLGDEDG